MSKLWEVVKGREAWPAAVHVGHKELGTTEQLNDNDNTKAKNEIYLIQSRLPRGLSGKESACQCRRCGFDSWVGKIPWRRKWQPAPVFLLGKIP